MPPTSPTSPNHSGRFINSAAARHPAELFIPAPTGEEDGRFQRDDISQRPAASYRPFDDPCNYLG